MVIETGEIIWQKEISSLPEFVEPIWSAGGEHVLFLVSTPGTFSRELIKLYRNGEVEELPRQPLPEMAGKFIMSLSRSPDGIHIFYPVVHNPPVTGSGYLLNTQTGEFRELCGEEVYSVLGGDHYGVDTVWIDERHLLYRSVIEKEGKFTHSLRILDIMDWVTWEFVGVDPGYGFNLFGWVSIEP
jgi:hypothetical protein